MRRLSSIWIPQGFHFAGVAAGIKKKGGLDLGLIEIPAGATVAALFTSNRVQAAPLQVGQAHLRRSRGRVRAVIVNSGNANCATGTSGVRACERICIQLGKQLHVAAEQVFPSSTGVIGVELPAEKIMAALPKLVAARAASRRAVLSFARAILTTDTRPKLAAARFRLGSGRATLLGVAKGAGMIHPRLRPALRDFGGQARLRPVSQDSGGHAHLRQGYGGHATMLVYLFTDIATTPQKLHSLLRPAVENTFNRISIDGDTSTNDTVLSLASGAAGLRLSSRPARASFAKALEEVCAALAHQIVADGEGVRHVVKLEIRSARTAGEADQVARTIANSALVKTAWAGADPNWGRILAAIGRSGVAVDPRRVNISLGGQLVCRHGAACRFDEARAHRELSRPTSTVRVELNQGPARTTFWTTDLTTDYVRVNVRYRS
jgi:glutamate N-acetyltransferase/amino-acid N-acetyltransferase